MTAHIKKETWKVPQTKRRHYIQTRRATARHLHKIREKMSFSFKNWTKSVKSKKKKNSTSNNSTALLGIHPLKDVQFHNSMTAELETEQSRTKWPILYKLIFLLQ